MILFTGLSFAHLISQWIVNVFFSPDGTVIPSSVSGLFLIVFVFVVYALFLIENKKDPSLFDHAFWSKVPFVSSVVLVILTIGFMISFELFSLSVQSHWLLTFIFIFIFLTFSLLTSLLSRTNDSPQQSIHLTMGILVVVLLLFVLL
ncbi:hypothetical protein [Geomicrobium sp. JCM 19039]|uniref:hypothetical protein n=1 Tax=Geomicrobium sp. JCM 19039 TaxID=1460636 RepID=UPI00045F1D89|nr:hypothetical protein [Geomicrobium sp. JCM 19039]GAK13296.1 hypothetical protein JCM19039_3134 [Geomicrobium sp. JCM 19039]